MLPLFLFRRQQQRIMGRTVLFFRYAGPLCADILIEIRAIFIFRETEAALRRRF